MNSILKKLREDKKLISIYFTAGYPEINDTTEILKELQSAGVDLVEIGLPFSDPLADGPTIQNSSQQALQNGMSTSKLFQQLKNVRNEVSIPLLIMGYLNPILQYGVKAFCEKCKETGINGLIIPDLPVEEYLQHYRDIFEEYDIIPIFLITPQTSNERIRYIDSVSSGFIYVVSSAGVTGSTTGFGQEQKDYFERVAALNLKSPLIVGFGISDAESYKQATRYARGGIIGSAFIKHLAKQGTSRIPEFIAELK